MNAVRSLSKNFFSGKITRAARALPDKERSWKEIAVRGFESDLLFLFRIFYSKASGRSQRARLFCVKEERKITLIYEKSISFYWR